MTRTTLDIDEPVLRNVRRLQRELGQSLDRLVSDLLADAVARTTPSGGSAPTTFQWVSQPMGARIDLADGQALWSALDRGD